MSLLSDSVPSESVSVVTLQTLSEEVLTATMALQSAQLGCLQSYNRAARSLAIVAQQGFKPDFLAHFQDCNDENTTWCQALARRGRVVIVDILSDAAFAPHRAAAEAAGYRAVQSTPLFGRGGEPLGIISTFFREPHQPSDRELRLTDLYARLTAELVENHLSEEALRASEARFRSYFELGLIGMAVTSPAKGILEVNHELCRILGYPRHEMLQKTWAEMTHPDDLAADVHQFNRVMAGEIEGYSLDKRWIRKDGRVIHSIMSAKCLRRVDGSVDYFVGLVLDTTERKHAEEALQKSRAELSHVVRLTTLGELAATIAHEVNQPLGSIVNNANAALKIAAAEPKKQEELGEVLSDIVKDAERASSIIARIRELAKRSTPAKEPLKVNDLVRDVLALAQRELTGRGITVRIEFPEDLPRVIGDRVQLQQVVLNLVMNGAEAMSAVPGPRRILTIGAERLELTGEPAVLITVSDLGGGFGAGDPERLFERFYTTKPGGLGIGLRISRSIVVAHGGRLWAQANEHAGATFLFSLPVEMPDFVRKPDAIVFVVDDDPSFRRSAERLLRLAGHTVHTFASALEFLNSSRPDVTACLVTDLRMPGLNGLDFQQELIHLDCQIPIIFITGHGDVPTSVRAMKAGAIEFLAKPFREQEFLDAIDEALKRDRTRREQAEKLAGLRQRYRSLTPRERDVMNHVIAGMLNKQSAAELNIVEKTIKFHRANIMAKMQADSLAELVRMAGDLGLLRPTI